MLIKCALMFAALCLGFAVLTIVNFWQIDHVSTKSLAGREFKSVWSFWCMYALLTAPVLLCANILFWSMYYYGFHFWFNKIWVIQISTFAAGLLMMALFTWLWYGEVPNKGTLVGIVLCAAGTLISIYWK